jgi:hypothetical protein
MVDLQCSRQPFYRSVKIVRVKGFFTGEIGKPLVLLK